MHLLNGLNKLSVRSLSKPPTGLSRSFSKHATSATSLAMVRKHRCLGKYYRCSQPFGPFNVYPTPSLYVLMAGEVNADEDGDTELLESDQPATTTQFPDLSFVVRAVSRRVAIDRLDLAEEF